MLHTFCSPGSCGADLLNVHSEHTTRIGCRWKDTSIWCLQTRTVNVNNPRIGRLRWPGRNRFDGCRTAALLAKRETSCAQSRTEYRYPTTYQTLICLPTAKRLQGIEKEGLLQPCRCKIMVRGEAPNQMFGGR